MKLHLYSSEAGLNPEYAPHLQVDCGAVLSHPQVAFCWDDVATGKKLEGMPPQTCRREAQDEGLLKTGRSSSIGRAPAS